ncbi:MAG TPA: PQQ-binding-like beta-propeller repeat protein [Phycisphaerae bacterium]|nr:PQQ-binding-like beta-propeller repeat protein [Phycisphaerales bacterium]HRX85641.1 PQQ-binding-like beta-propeller repeat protein [Phycisphaerae bacterium]
MVYRSTCTAAVIGLCTLAASAAESWSNYQGNPSHTGYTPVTLPTDQFAFRWSRTFSGALNPVTAADGRVFATRQVYFNDVDQLFVLDAKTGATEWTKGFGDVFSVNPPSYAYGNVYLQTGNHSSDTYLRAYDAATGALVFRAPHSAQWDRYYAPTIHDDKVFVNGGYYGGMYAFDAHDGTQEWFRELNGYDEWTPAVDKDYAYAYIGESCGGCNNAGLSIINRANGQIASFIQDPSFDWHGWSMDQAPVLGGKDDLLAIQSGRLISFDLANHDIGWQLNRNFSGQAAVSNGVVYAIDGGALTAWDQASGSYLWAWEAPSNLAGPFIVTDSHILISDASDTFALNLMTRSSDWSYPANGQLTLSEGVLYIADGSVLTAISIPEPASLGLLAGGACFVLRRRRTPGLRA